MATEGLCLVVSPLIALMKDQVENLRRKNITAFAIYSGMTRKEVINTLSIAGNSNCKFLYVSPERLETNLFKEYLPSFNINLIAIDEAHCISQWGYDFRPSYLKIAALREELPGVPVLALTASATHEVQDDICDRLLFKEKNVFRQSFLRPNLSYSVFNVPSKINKIVDILQKVNGTGIVYCKSRRRTREISDLLNMHGIVADYYHAGLLQEQRNAKQEAWLKDQVRIIVCTNAFGMGIDKSAVRIVIHADTPDCLENYYQEAGRAGRDGNKSYAVLLYNEEEISQLKELVHIRYPSLELIRKIYGDLMNHLQIASGTGEGVYFEIDINHFIKQFKVDGHTLFAMLKTLEQENILYFNEQVFTPSRLQVTANRERLTEIEKNESELDAVLKSLLRNYEGIIDQSVNIFENAIAANVRIHPDELIERLKLLHAYGAVDYQPQKNKPQVYLVHDRIKKDELQINTENYNKRKARFEVRLEKIIEYTFNIEECRSVIIGKYFGDKEIKDCGICDICLEKKKTSISKREFETINDDIIKIIRVKPSTPDEIASCFNQVPKYKIMEVIRFLQSEEKIIIADNGTIMSSF